jgi:hypothetical protein
LKVGNVKKVVEGGIWSMRKRGRTERTSNAI